MYKNKLTQEQTSACNNSTTRCGGGTNLLAELVQAAGLDEVRPLHGPRGGEGPAAAARSLVLNLRHSALRRPVHLSSSQHIAQNHQPNTG